MARRGAVAERHEYAYEDEQGEHWGARLLREVLEVALITLLLFMGVRLLVQNYRVDGPSMMPTLLNQQYILVDKVQYYLSTPQRGDIIVFLYPRDPSKAFVKRVVGLPGDTVHVNSSGMVTVNGKALAEPCVRTYTPQSWTLAHDQYFVLGDNRCDSSDSRDWGPVPAKNIIGKAALVYWPLPDFHALSDTRSVFSGATR